MVIFNLFYTLLGNVYLKSVLNLLNLFYSLSGSVYLRAIFDVSDTLLSSVYLRIF